MRRIPNAPSFMRTPAWSIDTAVGAGSFKTLVAALKAADLVDALKGDGPFTVFAPTDDAFAKLPAGTIETLLKPENKDKLAELVNNHIIAGGVLSSNFSDQPLEAQTLAGKTVTLSGSKAGDAKIEYSDVIASNGIVHVIDQVLVPKQ